MTRKDFHDHAEPTNITLPNGQVIELEAREFSTGTLGWYFSGKLNGGAFQVNGEDVRVQLQVSAFIVGSKYME